MKRLLIELDDRCARDLERVAPAKSRMRARFLRAAIRHAIDLTLDRDTALAYAAQPLEAPAPGTDLLGWDSRNELARPRARRSSVRRPRREAA